MRSLAGRGTIQTLCDSARTPVSPPPTLVTVHVELPLAEHAGNRRPPVVDVELQNCRSCCRRRRPIRPAWLPAGGLRLDRAEHRPGSPAARRLARASGDVAGGVRTVRHAARSSPPPNVAAAAIATAADAAMTATTITAMILRVPHFCGHDGGSADPVTDDAATGRQTGRLAVHPSRERRQRMSDLEAEIKDLLSGHRLSHRPDPGPAARRVRRRDGAQPPADAREHAERAAQACPGDRRSPRALELGRRSVFT